MLVGEERNKVDQIWDIIVDKIIAELISIQSAKHLETL